MAPLLTGLTERDAGGLPGPRLRRPDRGTGLGPGHRAGSGTGPGGSSPTASSGGCTVICPRWSAGSRALLGRGRTRWRWPGCNGTRPIARTPGSVWPAPHAGWWSARSAPPSSPNARPPGCAGMHRRVRGTTDDGRAYSAGDPELLRWVHLAFTDAFLAAQAAVGRDMRPLRPPVGRRLRRGVGPQRAGARSHRPAHHGGGAGRGPGGVRAGAGARPGGPARPFSPPPPGLSAPERKARRSAGTGSSTGTYVAGAWADSASEVGRSVAPSACALRAHSPT